MGWLQFSENGSFNQKSSMPAEEAVKVALDFVNQEMLPEGIEASLSGAISENGIYVFNLEVQGEEFPAYITQDGKILFPQGIDLDEVLAQEQAQSSVQSCSDVEKQNKPVLEAYVVSYCPYGLQMQRILTEVVNQMPALQENIKIRYIGEVAGGEITSMHGEEEAQENLRQICLREEQANKFFPYLFCFIKEGKTDDCLKDIQVEQSKLTACMTDKNRGVKYAKEDFELGKQYGITGSPSLILSGKGANEFNFGGRTAQAVKTLLCCGFTEEPSSCSQQLTEEQAAAGFSQEYSGSGSSGSCE